MGRFAWQVVVLEPQEMLQRLHQLLHKQDSIYHVEDNMYHDTYRVEVNMYHRRQHISAYTRKTIESSLNL